jgi:hypothetical protein
LFSALRRDPAAALRRAESADYDEMNWVWREFFPTDPPARTTFALQLSNGVEMSASLSPGKARLSRLCKLSAFGEWRHESQTRRQGRPDYRVELRHPIGDGQGGDQLPTD